MNRTSRKASTPAWRRVLHAIGGEPDPHWLPRAVHHGFRALLLLLGAAAVYLLFPAPRAADAVVLEQGAVAPEDIIAEVGFTTLKPEAELMREQAEAASGVPPVYAYNPAAADSVLAGLTTFFASVDSVATTLPPGQRRAALRELLEGRRLSPTPATVELLLDPQRRQTLERSLRRAVRELYPLGIVPSTLGQAASAVRVRGAQGDERLVPRDSLLTPERFFAQAAERLPADAAASASELQRLILIRYFQSSLAFEEEATEAARARARAAVDPVQERIVEGQKIVGAHELIGERENMRLRAYQDELTRRGMQGGPDPTTLSRSIGAILYNALVLGIFGALLWFFRRSLYHDWRAVTLFTVLALVVAAAAAAIARFALAPELIPVTFAALIVAVLWDGRLALSLALVLALLVGGQPPFTGITSPFTVAMGGAAAAFSVRIVQRRSKTWLFISIISLAFIAAAITIGLLRQREAVDVLASMGWGVTNAIVASLLAIGFLPLLESVTGITTDQTLLELADPNRRVLKRLSLEAPGTYAHTINVANLAETAARAIGANGLLTRVGTYYHDIGKLVKPQYFIENQPRGRNPHDKLKPSMSSTIIRSHVLEGLKLAEQEKLPQVIRDFITEHHGTQHISFFYKRARENDPDASLNPMDFSYPGPKPQSRETAILMLADSVESATRALQDPDPVKIHELVDRIVDGKIQDGQLDQTPLTLREIHTLKESFTTVLTGMYHHRIDYPAPQPAAPEREPVAADSGHGAS